MFEDKKYIVYRIARASTSPYVETLPSDLIINEDTVEDINNNYGVEFHFEEYTLDIWSDSVLVRYLPKTHFTDVGDNKVEEFLENMNFLKNIGLNKFYMTQSYYGNSYFSLVKIYKLKTISVMSGKG